MSDLLTSLLTELKLYCCPYLSAEELYTLRGVSHWWYKFLSYQKIVDLLRERYRHVDHPRLLLSIMEDLYIYSWNQVANLTSVDALLPYTVEWRKDYIPYAQISANFSRLLDEPPQRTGRGVWRNDLLVSCVQGAKKRYRQFHELHERLRLFSPAVIKLLHKHDALVLDYEDGYPRFKRGIYLYLIKQGCILSLCDIPFSVTSELFSVLMAMPQQNLPSIDSLLRVVELPVPELCRLVVRELKLSPSYKDTVCPLLLYLERNKSGLTVPDYHQALQFWQSLGYDLAMQHEGQSLLTLLRNLHTRHLKERYIPELHDVEGVTEEQKDFLDSYYNELVSLRRAITALEQNDLSPQLLPTSLEEYWGYMLGAEIHNNTEAYCHKYLPWHWLAMYHSPYILVVTIVTEARRNEIPVYAECDRQGVQKYFTDQGVEVRLEMIDTDTGSIV